MRSAEIPKLTHLARRQWGKHGDLQPVYHDTIEFGPGQGPTASLEMGSVHAPVCGQRIPSDKALMFGRGRQAGRPAARILPLPDGNSTQSESTRTVFIQRSGRMAILKGGLRRQLKGDSGEQVIPGRLHGKHFNHG
ncbi:hypothetical protein MBLNU230_g7087t1 [Neophaeotheca triangularis]